MNLVAGGTGTLGREIVRRLLARGEQVRVLTRGVDRPRDFGDGVDVVIGDIRNEADVTAAMRGCTSVISAVHGFAGPGASSPEAVDRDGNLRLIDAAKREGVERFVMVSVRDASAEHPMSLHRSKYVAEQALRASGVPFAIVRATAFLETWSHVLGAELSTKGRALVFGHGQNPINFVSVRDVADVVVECTREASAKNDVIDVIGPENIAFHAFATRLIDANGGTGKIDRIPLLALRVMSVVARPFAPAFARQAGAAVVMDTTDMSADDAAARGTTTLADVLASSRT